MAVFLQSTLTCKGSEFAAFLEVMAEIKPIVEAAGWRLDRAFVHRTGRLNVVVDIWELDDFNAYDVGIQALVGHPRFEAIKTILGESLISEEIVYLEKAPYADD
ncbi:MAG: NIPSNAP family protein [Pseudomonadota bacterium]